MPAVKVNAFRSVGAKLFCYMSLLVLITIMGNSYQYIRTFMAFQQDQVEDQAQLTAERSASQIESAIDNWRAQLTIALPTLRDGDTKAPSDQIQRFVDSSGEFLSLDLFEAPSSRSAKLTSLGGAFTSTITDPRFEDKIPAKVREQIQTSAKSWLKKQAQKGAKTNVFVESLARNVSLPVMTMAVRFDVGGSPSVVWALLTVWQTNLIKALPKSRFIDSAIIDMKGKVFTSPNVFDMVSRKAFSGKALAKSAMAGTSTSGFEAEYRDTQGRRRLGAYSRMPRYGLAILVEQDAEIAYQALKRNLLSTTLVALLFVLFAVAFSYVLANGITKSLRAVSHAASKIASGDFKHQIDTQARDEVGMLAHDVNNMSRKIVDLMAGQVRKARIEKESETAKMVQNTFFPRSEIRNGPIFLSGFYQPAPECGGDLWGHYTISDGVEFVFIGDAMGHGAPAALVTAMAYTTTMTIADLIRDYANVKESPARILERLNRILFDAVRGTISMTFFAAIVDTKKALITFANAGHNFPVLLPAAGNDPRAERVRPLLAGFDIQPISLKLRGTPLAMDVDSKYIDKTIAIRPGDKVLFFTDGLIECASPKGEVWGRKYLLEQAVQTAALSPTDMKDELLSRAFTFFGTRPLDDDVTALVLEVSKNWRGVDGDAASVAFATPADPQPGRARHPLPNIPPPRMPMQTTVVLEAASAEMGDFDFSFDDEPAIPSAAVASSDNSSEQNMDTRPFVEQVVTAPELDLASNLAMQLMPTTDGREGEFQSLSLTSFNLEEADIAVPAQPIFGTAEMVDDETHRTVESAMEGSEADLVRALTEATMNLADQGSSPSLDIANFDDAFTEDDQFTAESEPYVVTEADFAPDLESFPESSPALESPPMSQAPTKISPNSKYKLRLPTKR